MGMNLSKEENQSGNFVGLLIFHLTLFSNSIEIHKLCIFTKVPNVADTIINKPLPYR